MTLFKKTSRRRIISFLLAMSLIFTVFAIPMPTGADTLSELENQYKELEKERTQIEIAVMAVFPRSVCIFYEF